MKYLLLLLLLIGCDKSNTDHMEEFTQIKKSATLFCSCRGGILELEIWTYKSGPDVGYVRCINGESKSSVEEVVYSCGKYVNDIK